MNRLGPVNTGVRDKVVIPGTSKDLRSGFPDNVRINHADSNGGDNHGFVTFPVLVKNFEDTTYTHTSRYGEVLMSRNHDHGKPIPKAYRDGTSIQRAQFDKDTLSVVQVNWFLHREFVQRVQAIETEKFKNQPVNYGRWTIDYTEHVKLGRELGAEWSLAGTSMTAPDIPMNNEIHRHHPRVLVVAKNGTSECINLWGREARANDRTFLVLKMVEVKATTTYRTELMVCQNPGVPEIEGVYVAPHHYVPQYVACTSQHNTPHESQASYTMEDDDGRPWKFRAPYYLVGVVDINRSVDKFRRNPHGTEAPLVDTKVVYRNPEIYMHLFIT